MKRNIRFFSSLILIAILCLIPVVAFADSDVVVTATITEESLKDSYEAGDEIVVKIDLTSCGSNVGVVKGFLGFDKEKLNIEKIKKGGLGPNILAQGEDGTSYGEEDYSNKIMYWVEDEYNELEKGSIGTITFTVKDNVAGTISFQISNLTATTYDNKTSYTTEGVGSEERKIILNPTKPIISASDSEYTGFEQTAVVANYDEDTMFISGNKQTNAGTYTITVTSKTGIWKDGTSDAVSCEWIINPVTIVPSAKIEERDYIKGDTDATISNVIFEGLVNNEKLLSGVDYNATAKFTSDNVGNDKIVNVYLTLVENTKTSNYKLEKNAFASKGTINPVEIKDIELAYDSIEYTGEELKPEVTIEGLVAGKDFSIVYSNNTNAGIATVTVTGIGNYKGSVKKEFTITPKSITPSVEEIEDQVYTGEKTEPVVIVMNGTEKLVKDIHYIVSYSNNTNVTTSAEVTITARDGGNYAFEYIEKTFAITEYQLKDNEVTLEKTAYSHTGEAIEPEVSVVANGKTLLKGSDYEVEYSDNTEISDSAKVTISGKGNYSGIIEKTFSIKAKEEQNVSFEDDSVEKVYGDDNFINLATNQTNIGGTITYGSNNEKVAKVDETTGEVTIVGQGSTTIYATAEETEDYSETTITYNLNVDKKTITATAIADDKEYDGTDFAEVTVEFDGLIENDSFILGTDFEITSSKFEDSSAGDDKKVIVVISMNDTETTVNYRVGLTTLEVYANITKKDIPEITSIEYETIEYNGEEFKPEVTIEGLVAGTDYELAYTDNINVGTAKVKVMGKGNYTGKRNITFSITSKAIEPEIEDITSVKYNGEEQKPLIVVKDGIAVIDFTNYDVEYTSNTNVGIAKVKVTLKGNYTGSAEKEFEIIKGKISRAKAINLSQREGAITAVTFITIPAITDGQAKVLYEVDGVTESKGEGTGGTNSKVYTEVIPTKRGSYKVKLMLSGDSNLEDGEFELGILEIKRKASSSTGSGGNSTLNYKVTTKIENGTITPSNVSVKKNENQKFTFEANDGYEIVDVLIDGKSVGVIKSYTFEKVAEKHTIEVKTQKSSILANIDDWAKIEMAKAQEKGLIPETFKKKDASKAISRADFCAVAVKLYEALTGKKAIPVVNNPFIDTNDEYVLKAYSLGITKGISETEFGNGSITREQMATMETRTLEKAGINTQISFEDVAKFADDNEMHDWSKSSIYFMAKEEIIKGVGDNKFNVLGNAKIEESIAIALRCFEKFETK